MEVETGSIVGSSSVEVEIGEVQRESERYVASTFQTPYGIALAPNGIIVNGFNHKLFATYPLVAGADYLVSRRLSVVGRLGGFWMPSFMPTSFESSGRVRDNTIDSDGDIDNNGTFARSSNGDRIEFGAVGVSVQLGMAIHF